MAGDLFLFASSLRVFFLAQVFVQGALNRGYYARTEVQNVKKLLSLLKKRRKRAIL